MQSSEKEQLKGMGFWSKYISFMCRFDFIMVAICIICIVVTLLYVKNIQLRSDFREMLPDQFRSVIELNKIDERVKSSGNLAVVVGGDDWPSMRRFINDFVFHAKAAMPEDIAEIEYNARDVHRFYDENKYLYIDLPDLKEVHKRLKRQIDYEKIKQSPFYIEFDDEPPKFNIDDIEDKYTEKTSNYQHYEDGYFTNEEIDVAAILVKPREGATNVVFAEHLIAGLKNVIEELDPDSYNVTLKIGFGGRYRKIIEQYRALVKDILKTIILCVSLVGIVLLIYFKRFRMGIWMTLVVIQGTLITLSIARYGIGYLTSQTAFLGSIIVGNGIDYSLVILSRYMEERRAERNNRDSLVTSLATTWRATITSALTTSAAFGVLALTKIKGFSQFGFIGGIGMVMCWITTFFFLPSFVNMTERFLPLNIKKISIRNPFAVVGPVGKWVANHSKAVIRGTVIAIIVAIGLSTWYLPNSLEYDFSKLKFKPVKLENSWETDARGQLAKIFGQSTTPSVVLANSIDDVRPICESIRAKAKERGIEDIFDECKTIFDFVPEDQEDKLGVLADMRELLSGSTLAFLTEKEKREVEKFRDTFNLKELHLEDIPEEIAVNFEEVDGKRGLITYVYSNPSANLWDGKELIKFADLIREIELPDGKIIYSSGEPVIFADLLQTVAKEGPKITLISLFLVIILVVINFRRSQATVMIIGSLLVGILWLIGCLAIFGIKLNFLNFVALPISFGIGVDYAVNVYQRYRLEGKGSMPKVSATTGPAVLLCSSTTIIGYSVLMSSSSRALQSFGLLAVIGEICCLIAALVSMPALVNWLDRKRS
jgi:predicted RND superfamily exporter protein